MWASIFALGQKRRCGRSDLMSVLTPLATVIATWRAVAKCQSATWGPSVISSSWAQQCPRCKIWYSISQTVSDLGNIYDRSMRAFAVKPRAFGAPLSGFGA